MDDWNVVATLLPEGFRDAVRALEPFGRVSRTAFAGVLVQRTDLAPRDYLEAVREVLSEDATLANAVARLVPVMQTFVFHSAEEFEQRATDAVEAWIDALAGKRFFVRVHRRGFKGRMTSSAEERVLGDHLLGCLHDRGQTAQVDFDDPDVVVVVEMVGARAGVACWTREDMRRYELLRIH